MIRQGPTGTESAAVDDLSHPADSMSSVVVQPGSSSVANAVATVVDAPAPVATGGAGAIAAVASPVAGAAGAAIVKNRSAAPRSTAAASPKAAEAPRDIYQEALRALRGRYWLAIILAILGAAGGVAAVLHFTRPIYKSEALIQIALQRDTVFSETGQSRANPMFDAMLRAQIDVIKGQALLQSALQTPVWQEAAGGSGAPSDKAVEDMANDLTVEHPLNTDHLRIIKLDTDPHIAAATVNAIVDAYNKLDTSRESGRERERLSALRQEQAATEADLREVRVALEALSQGPAGGDIDARHENLIRRGTMLETMLSTVKLQLALKGNPTTQPQGVRNVPIETLARTDAGMQGLLNQQRQLENELDEMLNGPQKLLAENPKVIEQQRRIAKAKKEIEDYATQLRSIQAEVIEQIGGAGAALSGGDLEKQRQVIEAMKVELTSDMNSLLRAKDEMTRLKSKAATLTERIDGLDKRIRDVRLESSIGGSLNVISSGEVPLRPFYDPRKKLGIAAAMVGAGLPVALLVLLGLVSGKYRFVNETETDIARSAPLLGMLPSLPEKLRNRRQVADAAHSVHQIRVMLQMGQHGKNRGVYMVTSSTAGEGKTSLTVALGLSFAAAGCKTLIVDCDLVGQGITRGFRAERTTGLREALDCGSARGFVKKLPQGLRLLTAGNADTLNGWTLSAAATNRMLSEVRRYYDVVLIDTGPILGSVEAAVLAPAVDGVIMTIARGQQRSLVERAMQHLNTLGAEPVGFVFNRAQNRDLKHTSYYSSATSQYSSLGTANLPEPRVEDSSEVAAFGPLVRSVATYMRAPSDGDAD
jgi:capsular exopolysaccharide synthesis family protein